MGYDDELDDDLEMLDDGDAAESGEDGAALATDADVRCPYCGETVNITLDPAGGHDQDYVEDCEVCCRPWRVQVHYDDSGTVEVWAEAAQ